MANLDQKRQLALALKRKEMLAKATCFNPRDFTSRPTKVQSKILSAINSVPERYVLGGNQSGKSNLGGRECSWVLQGTHPNWSKKPDHPLLLMVVGQTHKIVKEELWESKIKPFLNEGEYRVYKEGSALTSVVHENGNKILFFSHKSPEECRQAVQAFVADWVWLDEMPASYRLLTELHTRCQANSAPFLATFTPLLRNAEIKNHVDNGNPRLVTKYFLKTYENPIYTKEQLVDLKERHALMSEAERATRTQGEWYAGDNAVYDFLESKHCELPPGYHAAWRHLESVDPAASGKAGYALLAENPANGIWYVIKAEYIEGKAPSELLAAVKQMTGDVNCTKKVADSHESWYIKEAGLHKMWYEIPHKKTERKKELIKNLQQIIHDGKLKVAPWCKLAVEEFTTCQWAESGDRIINSKHYHILDCLQYAVDVLPPPAKVPPVNSVYQIMERKDRERRAREAEQRRKSPRSYARVMPGKRSRWGKR
jgi:phage terminase large subunit-like protein